MKYNNTDKMLSERTKYRKLCKCGHSIVFYPFEKKDKKICSWCGHVIYFNDRIEFKEKIKKVINIENRS